MTLLAPAARRPLTWPPLANARALGLTIFILSFVGLGAFPRRYQDWDSIQYALWAMSGQTPFVSEHALSNALLYVLYRVATVYDRTPDAIAVMQRLNALGGAACIVLVYGLATRLRISAISASLPACLLLGSYEFWRLTGGAEIYTITLAVELAAFHVYLSFLRAPSQRWGVALGVFACVAVLAHRANVTLVVALTASMLYALARGQLRVRNVVLAGAALGLTSLVGFVALGIFTGHTTTGELLAWFSGYVFGNGIATDSSMLTEMTRGSGAKLEVLLATFTRVVVGEGFNSLAYVGVRWVLLAVLAVWAVWAAFVAWNSRAGSEPYLYGVLGLHVALTALAILWGALAGRYEPNQDKYWVLLLPALFLLMSAPLALRRTKLVEVGLAATVVGLLAFNVRTAWLPEHYAPDFQRQEARVLERVVGKHDLLFIGAQVYVNQPYLTYLGWDAVLHPSSVLQTSRSVDDGARVMRTRIADAAARGDSVYVSADAGHLAEWSSQPMRETALSFYDWMAAACGFTEVPDVRLGATEDIALYKVVDPGCTGDKLTGSSQDHG